MRFKISIKFLCFWLFLQSNFLFAQEQSTDSVPQKQYYKQVGVASYYARKLQGRKTASGERFDHNKLTAAHLSLPFGTRVKVTNLKTGRWVIVRINDRGPYHKKRIIDLTRKAAKHLGMLNGKGVIKVRIEEMLPEEGDKKTYPKKKKTVAKKK